MRELLQRAFAWGIAGLLVGPAAVYSLMLLVLWRDPSCRAGIAENCKLDVWLNLAIGAAAGFLAFFAITLIRGLAKRARDAID
jgi:hypothetical protein